MLGWCDWPVMTQRWSSRYLVAALLDCSVDELAEDGDDGDEAVGDSSGEPEDSGEPAGLGPTPVLGPMDRRRATSAVSRLVRTVRGSPSLVSLAGEPLTLSHTYNVQPLATSLLSCWSSSTFSLTSLSSPLGYTYRVAG